MLARRATLNTANSWLRAFDGFAHEFHNMPIQAESSAGRIDLFEQDHEFKLFADVPGLTREDIEISLDARRLSISAKTRVGNTDGKALLRERSHGSFRRVLILPKAVDAEAIVATVSDGQLTVTLPKRAESKPRIIEVS